MSKPNNDLGCLGYLFIAFAVLMLLGGLSAIGSDQVSHDCEGVATCIKSDD
jgi:hypothetical protein